MKIFTTLIALSMMSTLSYASSTQKLYCKSESIKIKAEMAGYTLSNIEVKVQDKSWNTINILGSTSSYDMFKSLKFTPDFPYPVYALNAIEGQGLLLALPGGDMRNYRFTGLLFVNGKHHQEIELDCTSNSN